jgi:hypothetical protein
MPAEQNNHADPEQVLLRLLRCMTAAEREEIIPEAIQILAKRCSLNPHYKHSSPEDIRLELESSKREDGDVGYADLDDRMMAAWPGDWPGRQIVDLDNVGDPGAWLSNNFGEPVSQMLFGWAWDDDSNAEMLAEEYLRAIIEEGHYPPSYYGDEDGASDESWTEEDEKLVCADFITFFRHWRERILKTIEKQNP